LLQSLKNITLLAGFFLYASHPAWSKSGCLLVVDLVRQEIVSPSEFQVELVSTLGDRVQTIALKGYHLEICDYDFGEYNLHIRAVGCFETTLLGIGKRYPSEETYRVPIPQCPTSQASGVAGTANVCTVHLRLKESHTKAIPGAVVRIGIGKELVADEFGRLSILLPSNGKSVEVEFAAKGFRRATERMRCESMSNGDTSYRHVILSPE
jgi:hypothetical protein